jgi:hypothetical protein
VSALLRVGGCRDGKDGRGLEGGFAALNGPASPIEFSLRF